MKRIFFIFLCVFATANVFAQNSSLRISGKVFDNITGRAIRDVSVQVISMDEGKASNIGISTKRDGSFELFFTHKIPFRLVFSHVSYYSQTITVNTPEEGNGLKIELTPKVIKGEDVIVTAELATEEDLKKPATIAKVSTVDVEQLASFNVFDLVASMREIDVATQSMTMQSVNTRGFNSSANKRFLQLTDGIDNRAPGLSFPIGNLVGLVDLDIASLELLPGPSSARYGSNAINGVLLMNSRDPFVDPGFSFQSKAGVNDFNLSGQQFFSAGGNGMLDLQARYAKAFNNKFAFKVTGSYVNGTDWKAENYENIGNGKKGERLPDQPGYNGVNVYGDETFSYLDVYDDVYVIHTLQGTQRIPITRSGPVTRTGYKESSLVDYNINTSRASGSLYYKFNDDYRIKVEGRYGLTNSLYTGDSRVRLDGFQMYQANAELNLNHLTLKGYSTWQNSGDSYNVSYLANTLIRDAKTDANWYRDFRYAYKNGVSFANIPAGKLSEARKFADSGITLLYNQTANARYEPGTAAFDSVFNALKYSTDPEHGAAIRDNTKLYNIESSYTISSPFKGAKLELGANYRFYDIDSKGTIFPDTTSNDITNYEAGGYAVLENQFLDDRLHTVTAIRADKSENFAIQLSPQVALNYSIENKHFFRLSFKHGVRFPGLREQFINDRLSRARLIGGLKQVVDQYDLQENSITLDAVKKYNEAVIKDITPNPIVQNPMSQTQAEIKNLPILKAGIIPQNALRDISPEKVNTFEFGYKRLFTPRLFLDLNYYVSFYQDFIGITRVVKPRTSPSKDLYTAAGQVNSLLESDRYFVYSNAQGRMTVQGASFDLEYLSGGFMASLNGSWAQLLKDSDDPIVPGFNTPPLKMNLEWGHRSIAPNFGFKMVYRFRTKYYWRSSFLDGPIDKYGNFDVQFNLRFPSVGSSLKFGVSNIGINGYYNMYGGPTIGSILFATYTFNPKIF